MKNVEVIKLSEKEIEIDGVIYDRRENKFSVGQWMFVPNAGRPEIKRIKSIDKDPRWPINFEGGGAWESGNGLRPATKEEIESHLIKVAKEKGYIPNSTVGINSATINPSWTTNMTAILYAPFSYMPDTDQLVIGGITVYMRGKWATILPSKKKLPVTKADHEQFIHDYIQWPLGIKDFMNQYE